jgi:hypothetical protein
MMPLDIFRVIVAAGVKFDQLIEEGAWAHVSFDSRMRGGVLTMRNGGHSKGRVKYSARLLLYLPPNCECGFYRVVSTTIMNGEVYWWCPGY